MKPFEHHIQCPDGSFQPLVLAPNFSVTLYQQSPLFNEETVPGTYSFPQSIPSKGNEKKLNFPEIFSGTNRPSYVKNRLYLEGFLWQCGQTKINKASCKRYQQQVFDNRGEFARLWGNKSIKGCVNVEYGIPCGDTDNCLNYVITDTTDNGAISGIVNNTSLSNGTSQIWNYGPGNNYPNFLAALTAVVQHVNLDNPNLFDFELEIIGTSTFQICPKDGVTLPTVQALFVQGNLLVEAPTVDPVELNICMQEYLDNLLANPNGTHVFPTYQNLFAFDGKNPDFFELINNYENGTYLVNDDIDGVRTRHTWTPFVSLKFILESIFQKAGYEIKGNLLSDPCFCKSHFQSNCLIHEEAPGPSTQETMFVPPASYNLSDCTPEMTINEFLDSIQKKWCVWLDWDRLDKCVTFNLHKDVFTQAPKKGFQYLICGQDFEPCYDSRSYTLKHKAPTGDKRWIEGDGTLDNLIIGDGETPIETGFAPTYNGIAFLFINNISTPVKVPWVLQTGSTSSYGIGNNDFGNQIVLWHGDQGYPMAANDDTFVNGTPIDPNNRCSLDWDGEFGTYETYWSKWLDAQQNGATIPVQVLPDPKFVFNHKPGEVYWLTINDITGCFIFKEMRYKVGSCGLEKTTAQLFYLSAI